MGDLRHLPGQTWPSRHSCRARMARCVRGGCPCATLALFITKKTHQEQDMDIQKIHHVAYRCRDAKETVLWYKENLGMDFVLAIAEDRVPSTKAEDPYMHVF